MTIVICLILYLLIGFIPVNILNYIEPIDDIPENSMSYGKKLFIILFAVFFWPIFLVKTFGEMLHNKLDRLVNSFLWFASALFLWPSMLTVWIVKKIKTIKTKKLTIKQ